MLFQKRKYLHANLDWSSVAFSKYILELWPKKYDEMKKFKLR